MHKSFHRRQLLKQLFIVYKIMGDILFKIWKNLTFNHSVSESDYLQPGIALC